MPHEFQGASNYWQSDWLQGHQGTISFTNPICMTTDSKIHGVNMGPTWVLSAPDGPHVGSMNHAIGDLNSVITRVMPNYNLTPNVLSSAGTWLITFFLIPINPLGPSDAIRQHTVYPKKYAHGFCFAVLCCGYTLTDFPISIRLTSLALWQSNDCPSASKATLTNMDKYFMWIHYERLHNHNKAKHNKTVCIFLGIYCRSVSTLAQVMSLQTK